MLQVRRNLRLLRDSRDAMVPTSAKDCRKRAAACVRLMRTTRAPGPKQALREQAAFWLRMATEMKRVEGRASMRN
jgi:transcription initiation factor TFIIIB Brf1 subunit/transcription initiation factor TFIIB